jgi:hypothetical protein
MLVGEEWEALGLCLLRTFALQVLYLQDAGYMHRILSGSPDAIVERRVFGYLERAASSELTDVFMVHDQWNSLPPVELT